MPKDHLVSKRLRALTMLPLLPLTLLMVPLRLQLLAAGDAAATAAATTTTADDAAAVATAEADVQPLFL
jgi:hypothetical protein